MVKVKHSYQVSKQIRNNKAGLRDLEVIAKGIVSKGIDCAIYIVGERLVLMRDIGDDDMIQSHTSAGVLFKEHLKDTESHILVQLGIMEGRKLYKEYKVKAQNSMLRKL